MISTTIHVHNVNFISPFHFRYKNAIFNEHFIWYKLYLSALIALLCYYVMVYLAKQYIIAATGAREAERLRCDLRNVTHFNKNEDRVKKFLIKLI